MGATAYCICRRSKDFYDALVFISNDLFKGALWQALHSQGEATVAIQILETWRVCRVVAAIISCSRLVILLVIWCSIIWLGPLTSSPQTPVGGGWQKTFRVVKGEAQNRRIDPPWRGPGTSP